MTIAPTNLSVEVTGNDVTCKWDYQNNQYLVGEAGAPADLKWSHNWSENTFVAGQPNTLATQNGSAVKHSYSTGHIDTQLFGGAADAGGCKPVPFATRRYPDVPNALRCFSTNLDNTNFVSYRQEVRPQYFPLQGEYFWFGTSVYWPLDGFERSTPGVNQFCFQLLENTNTNLLISGNSYGRRNWRINTDGAWGTIGQTLDIDDHFIGRHVDIVYGVYLHPTQGWLKVWIDGRLIFNEVNGTCGYKDNGSFFYPKVGEYGGNAKNQSAGITNTDCLSYVFTTRISDAADGFDTVAPSPCTGFVLKIYEDGNLIKTVNPDDPYMGPAVREYKHTVADASGKTYTATLAANRQGVLSAEINSVEGPTESLPLVVTVTTAEDLSQSTFTIPCAPALDDLLILCCSVDGTPTQSGGTYVSDAAFTRLAGDESVNTAIPDETANGFIAWRRADGSDVGKTSYTVQTRSSDDVTPGNFEQAGLFIIRVSGVDWTGGTPWAATPVRTLVNRTTTYTSPALTTTYPDALIISALLNVGNWQVGGYPTTTETWTSADINDQIAGRSSIAMTTKVGVGAVPTLTWTGLDANTSGARVYTLAIKGEDQTTAPVWGVINDQSTLDNDGAKTLDISTYVTTDAGPITAWDIAVVPANAEFSVDSAGLLTLAADPTVGTYTITPSATNSKGTTSPASFDWEVTSGAVDQLPVLLTYAEPADLSHREFTIPMEAQIDDLFIVVAAVDGTVVQSGATDITDAVFTRISGDTVGSATQIGTESLCGFVAWRRADASDVAKSSYHIATDPASPGTGSYEQVGITLIRIRGVDWTGGDWWSVPPSRTPSAASTTTHTATGVTTAHDNVLVMTVLLTVGSWVPDSYPTTENIYDSIESESDTSGLAVVCSELQATAGPTGDKTFTSVGADSRAARAYILPIKTSGAVAEPIVSASATVDQNTGIAYLSTQSNVANGTMYAAWYAGTQAAKSPEDVKAGTGSIGFTNAPAALYNQFTVPPPAWEQDYFAAFVQETP